MPNEIIPGIYNREDDSGPRPIASLPEGIIGLVGTATRGSDTEIKEVSSIAELEKYYGSVAGGSALSEYGTIAINNGAQRIKCVRVLGSGASEASRAFAGASDTTVTLTCKWKGTDGRNINVTITSGSTGGKSNMVIKHNLTGQTESYPNFDMLDVDDSYLVNRINAESELVTAASADTTELPANVSAQYLAGGSDGTTVAASKIGRAHV